MTLQLPSHSLGWGFAAAQTVLALYLRGGSVGLVSGGVALVVREGRRLAVSLLGNPRNRLAV